MNCVKRGGWFILLMTMPLFLRRWRWDITEFFLRFGLNSKKMESDLMVWLRKISLSFGLLI